MESENQVLRQQSLVVATADEDKSKQIERYILQYVYLHSHLFFSFFLEVHILWEPHKLKKNGLFRLESKIAILESEIQLLRSNSAPAVQAVVTPEMYQTSVMEVSSLEGTLGKHYSGTFITTW